MASGWTKGERRTWLEDLAGVLALFGGRLGEVLLIFSSRRVPGVFALCDPAEQAIALFPRARAMGRFARRETLIHECCHLVTTGLHSPAWKREMRRVADEATRCGQQRLAGMVLFDLALYDRREVSEDQVARQALFYRAHLADSSRQNLLRYLADWAGWPQAKFADRWGWIVDQIL